jgi:acetyl esterase/lipase
MITRTLLLFALSLGLLHAGPLVPPPGTQTHRDLPYVDNGGPYRTLDLYLPAQANGKLPVVIWIHGGAWRGGAKGGWCPATGLLTKGYALADINYRLAGAPDYQPFPVQLYDCKAAVRWLRANAAQYNLDPDHIGVWGHSAGAHLAAMLGVTGGNAQLEGDEGNLNVSSAVQAVCAWACPSDIVAFLHGEAGPVGINRVSQLLGGRDLKAADDDKAKVASPLTYVAAGDPPFMMAQGTIDTDVPPADSAKLSDALKAAGVECTYISEPGKAHGIGGPELEQQADDFFDKHLKSGATPAPGQ